METKNAKGKNSKGKKDEEDGLHRVKMRAWTFKMMTALLTEKYNQSNL